MASFLLEVKVQLPVWVAHTVEVEGEDLDDAISEFKDNPGNYISSGTRNRGQMDSTPDDCDVLDTEVYEDECAEIE